MLIRALPRLLVPAALALGASAALAQQPAPAAPNFTVDVSKTTPELKVGEKGTFSVVITPAAGKKVHEQAPLIVAMKPPKGLQFAKTKLGHADVANPGAAAPEVKTEFTAMEAGPQSFPVEMQFFVCTEKWCERQQTRVQINVTVK